jgi:hypothetical protein
MLLKNQTLARRTFLRGMGVTLGLPLLNAMGKVIGASPEAAATASAAKKVQAPVRMACIYFPNGVWEKNWFPEQEGANYELPFALEPLAPLRDEFLVFSNFDKQHSHQGDGHYAKTANFLTGMPVRKTPGKDISVGGISIDQLCAQQIGHHTPLPSLELGIDPVISGIDSVVGYTRLYGCYISWRSPSTPVAREINPRLAYERLFGVIRASNAVAQSKESQDNRALLDLVLDDAHSLRRKLGRDDQYKLDEYLDSVRDVERRLEFFSKPDGRDWKPKILNDDIEDIASPKGAPGDHQEHVRLMLDLMAIAFWTDSTRISSFMFANDVSPKNFAQLIPGASSHHELSHHQNKAEKYEPYSKINRWHNEQLAYFMNKLKAIKEGEGTLLDNSMVLFGSSFSDGNRHDPNNVPVLLAGKAGHKIKSGRHIKCAKKTPLCNLYVSMLDRMGTPVESFGDSNGDTDLG